MLPQQNNLFMRTRNKMTAIVSTLRHLNTPIQAAIITVIILLVGGTLLFGDSSLKSRLFGGSNASTISPAAASSPTPSQLPYGVTTIHADAQLVKDFNDSGVKWVRYQVVGSSINWTQLDSDIHYLNQNGIHIDFSIHCLTTSSCFSNTQVAPVADYANLAAKLAARYNGSGPFSDYIDAFEIGNEEFDALSPSAYPPYLKAGCMAIKQYSPHALCGMYGTYTPDLTHYSSVVSSIFSAGDGQYMDFMNYHYYVHGKDPSNPGGGMPSYDQVWQAMHAIASQHGYANLPVWVTEVGWPTATVSCCQAVTPQQQSQYLTYVMDHSRKSSNAVQRVFWFTMDYGDQGDSLDRTSTGRLPAFTTLQNYIKTYPTWSGSSTPPPPPTTSVRKPANIEYDGDVSYGSYQSGNLSNPNVAAVDINMDWANVEPTQGGYNWGPADKEMSDWSSHNKKFTMVVRYILEASQPCSSFQALPAWEAARVPNFCSAKGDVIPDYFNATFKADLTAYITALGQHIAASPYKNNLEYIRIGLGQAGEPYPCLGCSQTDLTTLNNWGYSTHNWALWQEGMLSSFQKALPNTNIIYALGDNDADPTAGVPVAQEVGYWAAAQGIGVGQQGLANSSGYANGEAVQIMKYVRSHYPNAYIQFQTNHAETSATDIAGDIKIAESAGAWSIEWYAANSTDASYQSLFSQWQQYVDSVTCGNSCNGTPPPNPSPTVTLSANPVSVSSGGSSMLTWSSTNASSCTASGAWSGSQPTSGNAATGPLTTSSTFTLTCTGNGGNATATAVVSVGTTPPPPPPPSTGVTDNFQRANQSGWGKASSGLAWILNGQTFAISNNTGYISGNGASTAYLGGTLDNSTVTFSGSLSGMKSSRLGAVVRYHDDNDWYMAYFDGAQFDILKRKGGTYTTLASKAYAAAAHTNYSLRLQYASGKLSAKIWATSGTEPSGWSISASDSSLGAGYSGIRAGLGNNYSATITSFTLTQP